MSNEELLKNEKLEKMLSPHPLSFMRYQALCIFLFIWGVVIYWLANVSDWKSLFIEFYNLVIVWAIILLILGVIV